MIDSFGSSSRPACEAAAHGYRMNNNQDNEGGNVKSFAGFVGTFGMVVALMGLVSAPLLAADQAPAATYVATTGSSAVTGGGTGAGGGHAHGSKGTDATKGGTVTIAVNSYTTEEELAALKATAGDAKKFFDTLKTYNHGTVTVGGKTYPINAASSVGNASGYSISLASAVAYAASGSSHSAKGATGGYIHLTVDSTGSGKGSMFTSTQIIINSSTGDFEAKAGMSTATQLSDVKKQ